MDWIIKLSIKKIAELLNPFGGHNRFNNNVEKLLKRLKDFFFFVKRGYCMLHRTVSPSLSDWTGF